MLRRLLRCFHSEHSDRMLRLGSLNICSGYGNQLGVFLNLFEDHDLDVVCVQEISHRQLKMMMELARLSCGGRYQYSAFVPADFIGNAIISRYPIRSSREIALNVREAFQRGAVLAEIEAPQGLVTVVCLHLDHIREPARQQQMAILYDAVPDASLPEGFVLCGDFNALHRNDYSDEEWQVIADVRAGRWEPPMQDVMGDLINTRGFVDALRESTGVPNDSRLSGIDTTCRFNTRIDFLLHTPGCAWRFARDSYRVVPTTLTDHSLVTVQLERSES